MTVVMAVGVRYESLDLLRGLAALAVVTLHAPRAVDAAPLLPHAYLAVDLFFGLSGFVIAHAYWQRLRDGMSLQRFLLQRLIRLYPLYLLATVVGVLVFWHHLQSPVLAPDLPDYSIAGFFTNLLFLPAFSGNAINPLFPAVFPAWSLFWELIANLIFAIIAPRLNWRLLCGVLAVSLVLLLGTGVTYGTLNVGATCEQIWAGEGRVLWSFFAGVAVYRLHQTTGLKLRIPIAIPGIALIGVFAPPLMGWGYDVALALIAFPFLIFASARIDLNSVTARWLASISYAVYIVQAPVLSLLEMLFAGIFAMEISALPLPLTTALLVTATLAASTLATRQYDEPVRAWLRTALRARERRTPALIAS